MSQQDDHGPEGLAADLPHLTRRRVLVTGLAMGGAALSLWAVRGGAQTVTGTAADGAVCVALPPETAGPFPADGTNVREGQLVNILSEQGVIREDLRRSIGELTPIAEGVVLALEITLVDVRKACAPLAGHAVYLWQCDAEGVYSIYGAADRNHLRGVGISDAQGRVKPSRQKFDSLQISVEDIEATSGQTTTNTLSWTLVGLELEVASKRGIIKLQQEASQ